MQNIEMSGGTTQIVTLSDYGNIYYCQPYYEMAI